MVEKSQDKEMDKSVAVGNVENNSENCNYSMELIFASRVCTKRNGVKSYLDLKIRSAKIHVSCYTSNMPTSYQISFKL